MYPKPLANVERYRITDGPLASDASYGNNGQFLLKCPETNRLLLVQASDGEGWEHVSVSLAGVMQLIKDRRRTPTWEEMCYVKRQFWQPEETVVEYHPPRSRYVNNHPYVLHLFRPLAIEFPMPPLHLI